MSGRSIQLTGIDGTNPLGFLAALGALVVVRGTGERNAMLRWTRARTWSPVLDGLTIHLQSEVIDRIATGLKGRVVSDHDEQRRLEAQREFDQIRTSVMKKAKEIRRRSLSRRERADALEAELRPLERELARKRAALFDLRKKAVPRAELAIGQRIDCTADEYREHVDAFFDESSLMDREALDLLAAFASDACTKKKSDVVMATPFCFISGSGRQYFLDTVRQLMSPDRITTDGVRQVLFEGWTYRDKGLSMRWDPVEDRRYALMDEDPAASGNEPRTFWMANLLAYRGLVLFASAPGRSGLVTTGWSRSAEDELQFTWPLWERAVSVDVIRSLLQSPELAASEINRPAARARGVCAVYRSRRIQVGSGANYKLNFSPAHAVMS